MSRSLAFAEAMPDFMIIGSGEAARTSAHILRGLGARVTQKAADADFKPITGDSVVICDVVSTGADADYRHCVQSSNRGLWVTVSAFGLDGPLGGLPGSDLVCAAAGGLLGAVADADRRHFPLPGSQALQVAGQIAVLAALHGLSIIRGTNDALHLDVSAQEAVAFCSVQQEVAHLLYECGGRAGVGRYSSPSGVFPCRDGEIEIVVLDDHQWQRISQVLIRPEWPEQYPTLKDRQVSRSEIDEAVSAWTSLRPKLEAEHLLQAGGVPAVAVRTLKEVADLEQYRVRDFSLTTSDGELHTSVLPARVTPGRHQPGDRRRQRLDGLRVLEATNVLAGPIAGAILGAMGAEVVRLEDERRLDIYRRKGPFQQNIVDRERAAYFLFANFCKRSAYRHVSDRAFVKATASWANFLLENIGPNGLARLGIDPQADFTMAGKGSASISGFGRTGPCAEYKAYASNVHAFAGLDWAAERNSGIRVDVRTAFADYCVAVWAATLAASWWLGGAETGVGLDLSMAEVISSKLNGLPLDGTPADGPALTTQFLIRLPDAGHIALAVPEPMDHRDVTAALGILAPDVTASAVSDVTIIDASSCAAPLISLDDVARIARSNKLWAVSPVHYPADVITDEQLNSRGFLMELEHPVAGPCPIFALPWKEAFQERRGYRRAPLLGEDDAWVERVVGYCGPHDGIDASVTYPVAGGGSAGKP